MTNPLTLIGSADRVAIIGGPRSGKTTLAKLAARPPGSPVLGTDSLIKLGWSQASAEVARWIDTPGPTLIEGVATARGLRKWLAEHTEDDSKPFDLIVVLKGAKRNLTLQQQNMGKGVHTVLYEILGTLAKRGVNIVTVDA